MRLGLLPPAANSESATSTAQQSSWIDKLLSLGTAYLTFEQQQDLLKVNAQRAAQGLQPLDISQYSGAGVNVGLASGTQNTVLLVAGIVGGTILLSSLLRGRRRR